MSKRAAAAALTRRRILEATHDLHAERGIAATGWDDIAARAGVGVGTVYRHFPSLDELIPACGELAMEIVALPDVEEVRGRLAGLRTPAERLRLMVGEAFAIYERGAAELRAIRDGRHVHPRVAADLEGIEATLDALVEAALPPLAGRLDRGLARAMIDLATWEALRDQGLGPADAADAVAGMLAARLAG